MRLAADMSSIMWTCLLTGKDAEGSEHEDENGKKHWVNKAEHGYEYAINSIVAALSAHGATPIDMVMVFEGLNSKARRLMIFKDYKGKRGKRPVQAYEEFNRLKAMLADTFKKLGAIAISQDGVEADDVIGFLAKTAKDTLVVLSNDNDLSVLSGINEFGAQIITRIGGNVDTNTYGMFPMKYVSLYKALVGDTNDNISGIPGFGPAAWMDFHAQFGEAGMAEMVRLASSGTLKELEEEAEQNKLIARIWNGRDDFLRSWKLASLHPEWVNTMQEMLDWQPGMVFGTVNDQRLTQWQATRRLITADRWDDFVPRLLEQLKHRSWFTLDAETSTPDESDEWLAAQEDPNGVDVIGSELTGFSLTFGSNMQHTVYIPVDHADTNNVSKEQVFDLLKQIAALGKEMVIHNTAFEGPVFYNEFGKQWKDNGYEGFLPNWRDTKLEASYVDENDSLGLKKLSKRWLGYDQVDYNTVTTVEEVTGPGEVGGKSVKCIAEAVTRKATLEDVNMALTYAGCRRYATEADLNAAKCVACEDPEASWPITLNVGDDIEVSPAQYVTVEKVQYKMRELSAKHVFNYACDDTVTTAALHNFFRFFMEMENTYRVYEEVELKASYLHAQSFVHGTKISLPVLAELNKEDTAVYEANWAIVRQYLIEKGWDGTATPVYSGELTAANVKEAHLIVTGQELKTMVRTVSKLIAMVADPLLVDALTKASTGVFEPLNTLVASRFTGEPEFNMGSPKQKQRLFYEVMGLTAKVHNKPTDAMRAQGLKQGAPKTDSLAIAYALMECAEREREVLEAMRLMQMVLTRRGLFYNTYGNFVHWKTGRVHSSHNQCATNTRRASSSKPNTQQLSKHARLEGYSPRIRELFIPHKKNAVIVSMDFMAQELRVIADYSKDPNMLSCFVGDNLKDMHALTGLGIYNSKAAIPISYEQFIEAYLTKTSPIHNEVKVCRSKGKGCNFSGEYGAQAPKMASVLFVSEEEAQTYLDAREAAFSVSSKWKLEVQAEARHCGYVTTKLGARRHLRDALLSTDRYEASKAERQAVNFKIQGSSAEMTKLSEGRMWEARLEQRFDCEIIMPVHDEIVASVAIDCLFPFLKEMHACMVYQYADMVVPVKSSISLGRSFGHQSEVGEDPSSPGIVAALEIPNLC